MDQVLFARIVREQCSLTHDLLGGAKGQLAPSVILVCSINGTGRGATSVSQVIENYKPGDKPRKRLPPGSSDWIV
jgi:hypothetical protein